MNASVVAHAKPCVQAPSCSTPTCLTHLWHATVPAHSDGLPFRGGAAAPAGLAIAAAMEMVDKLRDVMGKRDDDTHHSVFHRVGRRLLFRRNIPSKRDKPLKRGRGVKTKVLVMAESKTVENPKPGKETQEGQIPEDGVNDLKAGTITGNVQEHVESTAD